MVLRLKVPYAFKVRESVRVPWLVMCATLCYRGDLLSAKQTMNQRVERYSVEHDELPTMVWDLGTPESKPHQLADRPDWLGVRPEERATRAENRAQPRSRRGSPKDPS